MEKDVKLQLPIMMGTYPFRTENGSFDGKLGTHYPSTLPILRPWLEEKTFKWSCSFLISIKYQLTNQ